MKHCHLCGRRLWTNGWAYALDDVQDDQSVVVCRQCRETAHCCDVCGVPTGDKYISLPDDRRICTHCHHTAVYNPARAQAFFERVTRVVIDQLGLALNVGVDLTLVDDRHLQRLATESFVSNDEQGKIIGLFVRRGRRRTMYVLSGLPQILLVQTIAHEWAHAWQGENCPLLQDAVVREGFAEWVAYKTLQTMEAVDRTALMEQQNGLYGDGLRKMLELERRSGVSGVIAFCRRAE